MLTNDENWKLGRELCVARLFSAGTDCRIVSLLTVNYACDQGNDVLEEMFC